MAYLLSVGFLTPFCYRETQFQGTHTRRLSSGRLINPATSRTGEKHLLLHKYSGGGMISSNGSSDCSICALTRQCVEPFLCHFDVCFSDHVLITGFWVGPDIEDGWGFVEAFVHHTY
ncbi:hypothetical protein CDL12_03336 [Handroanthus impetiginosus]|uniref:Uncharacterized protein n=1 Tax=Handroanthus impetiginosus TaxID=429701 RepID=A0A2G9I2V5_9LAMI|nr:hypothetical protein CDL12_03336 [Handroanthus impetiginosus]